MNQKLLALYGLKFSPFSPEVPTCKISSVRTHPISSVEDHVISSDRTHLIS